MKNKDYTIEVEMTDGGKLITEAKYSECFVTRNVVKTQQDLLQQKLGGYMCFEHYKLPEVQTDIREGLVVLKIACCCEKQLNTLGEYFEAKNG